VFSFYATKPITTGEGGMVVTDDDEVARRISVMRLHGIDRDAWDRYRSTKPAWEYAVVEAGYKYNMPDLLAAIGRVQLAKSESFLERRRSIARTYSDHLRDLDYLRLPPRCDQSSWHLYVIRLRSGRLTIGRNEFIQRLSNAGIGTSVHFIPLHTMPYYADRYGLRAEDFPVSLAAYQAAISLPIYPTLTDEQVARVVTAIRETGDSALR
jgi:dTDP-4-amino-4,6-dideoxygalactose transaminase